MPQRSDLLFAINVVANLKDPAEAMAIVSAALARLDGVMRAEIVLNRTFPQNGNGGHASENRIEYFALTHRGANFGYCEMELDAGFTDRARADVMNALKIVAMELHNRRLLNTKEKQARKIEERLSLVARNMGDIVTITDDEGRIQWVNDTFERICGHRLEDVLGLRPSDFLHGPLTDPETKAELRKAIQCRKAHRCEIINYRKSGEYYWIEFAVTPINNPDGSPNGFIGVGREITRRRQAENALRKRNSLLEELEQVGHIGGWEIFPETGEIFWSDETYRIFGREPGTPLDENTAVDMLDEASREAIRAALDRAITEGAPWDLECTGYTADGRPLRLISRGRVDRSKEELRLFGAVMDITAHREEQVQRKRLAERLEIATRAGKIGLWEWDMNTNRLYQDQSLMELFGFPTDSAFVPIDSWVSRIHMEDRLAISQNMEDIRNGGPAKSFRYRFLRDDGATLIIQTSGPTIIDNSVIGIAWDARADVAREERLQKAVVRAEDASRAKSAFLTQMSHELRTPLNAIIGFSDLIKDGPDLTAELVTDYARNINEAGRGLLKIINDILDFSALESGGRLLRAEPVDLCEITESVIHKLSSRHDSENIICIHSKFDESAPVSGDANLLRQLVENLVANAIRCNKEARTIEVGVSMVTGNAQLSVIDHGAGMSKNEIDRLFEPFFELDNPYQAESYGSGLGLAIVKLIAELHGATISCEEIAKGGHRVTVTFDAQQSDHTRQPHRHHS